MEKTYYPTIGIEVHAELATKTKMFCDCVNDPEESVPNRNVCEVCLAHPGALPVANKEAIKSVVKVGLAFKNAKVSSDFSEFDRKNYFYPDIPKGYQISQYKYPFVESGEFAGFKITRVHLEEDTATSKHDRGNYSLVDFNRAGVPLMELVTDANTYDDFQSAAKGTSHFAKELQLLLKYLGVSHANMEKGEMRVEANISVSPDKDKWGTKVEVKNLNSFKSVEKAVLYELERMKDMIERGDADKIVQETRGWDEAKQSTFSQRSKESAQEYRYFPDPDLPKMSLGSVFDIDQIQKDTPMLPDEKRLKYKDEYKLKDEAVEVFINSVELSQYYESVISHLKDVTAYTIASNLLTSDYIGIKKSKPEAALPSASNFAELVSLFAEGKISSRVAKDILARIVTADESPSDIVSREGLSQSFDPAALTEIVMKVIAANEKTVADYKSGKENAIMGLVGQVMKETKGAANPQVILEELKKNV